MGEGVESHLLLVMRLRLEVTLNSSVNEKNMGPDHEYSILSGVNRSNIGRILGMIAGGLSSIIVLAILAIVDIAKAWGLASYVPQLVLWPVGAGAVYLAVYWAFDRHVWKLGWVAKALKLPNLAGVWVCKGRSLAPDGNVTHRWDGTVQITQSWDRLKIRLTTNKSRSESIAAALFSAEDGGHRVMYHYINTPNVDQPELNIHRGFAEITFDSRCAVAAGEYFNGQGRFTFGTFSWSRQ